MSNIHKIKKLLKINKVINTFHPLGIEKPLNTKSAMASLKAPWRGGASLKTSHATFHEYFIF